MRKEAPDDLLKDSLTRTTPGFEREFSRRALKGEKSKGNGAWLNYPPPSIAYRRPRTLGQHACPGKTFEGHGLDALRMATLQPVDSIFNSIRARTASAGPAAVAGQGRGYRKAYFRPAVVLNEMTVYLLSRNYRLRRKTDQKKIPAVMMGLARLPANAPRAKSNDGVQPSGPRAAPRHESRLDLAKVACDFSARDISCRKVSQWRQR